MRREREEKQMGRWRLCAPAIAVAMGVLAGMAARADQTRHFSFAYDQPHSTGYGIAADLFNGKLMELSQGSMAIDQFPGAQLGQEPQMLQKIRTGDIDFMISSTANAATVAPESGVLSIHYLFRSEDQLIKAIADPRLITAVREMFDATVKDGHVLALATLGLRDLYGKRPVTSVGDLKGFKVRVQATPTEDTLFPAYGAQTIHMPFGSVYTSLQTGVVDFAENGVNVYDSNKHYEVAPVLSMTEHEANNSVVWVSDKLWSSLSDEQKGWVREAAAEVGSKQPAQAIALEHKSLVKLQKLGVKVITDVDKASFIKIAEPLQDKLAKSLGPHAEKILQVCRSIE
jgi:tripartite ATP-independent transporter DctP family solute receptor